MTTQTYTGTLFVLDCAACHITFGIEKPFERARRKDHTNFYCPSGHTNYYPQETDEERLRRELAAAEGQAAAARARAKKARDETALTKRRLAAAKGQLTKMRKRIAQGVCPVAGCRRSGFVKVKAHLASKHPVWLAEHEHELDAVE